MNRSNHVTLDGYVNKDIELRTSAAGNKYVFFQLSVPKANAAKIREENKALAEGEQKKPVYDYISCAAYGDVAEGLGHCKSGSRIVTTDAALSPYRRQRQDGTTEFGMNVTINSCVTLPPRQQNNAGNAAPAAQNQQPQRRAQRTSAPASTQAAAPAPAPAPAAAPADDGLDFEFDENSPFD